MKLKIILKTIIFLLLALIIIISPLFIGSVEHFSKLILRFQIVLCFIIWLFYSYFCSISKGNSKISREFVILSLFSALCLFQIVPLPALFVKHISPSANEIWNFNVSILGKMGLNTDSHFQTISLIPYYSLNKLLSIISYILLGYIVSKVFTSKKDIKFFIYVISFVMLIETTLGCYQFLTGNSFFDINKKYFATGTFVNKNHFAGFLELTIPIVLGYLFYLIYSKNRHSNIISISRKVIEIALFSFIGGFSIIVFIFSLSRMGYLSLFSSILISFFIYFRVHGSLNKKILIPLIFIVTFMILGIYKSFDIFSERVSINNIEVKGRAVIFKDTLNAIKDFPLLGSGLGTFKEIYPRYKTLEEASTVNFTHNDYLQLTLETGLVGISLLFFALLLFFKSTLSRLKRLYDEREFFYFFVKLGCLGSIISILLHSFADFNLHIPSNAAYFAILFGIIACEDSSQIKPKIKENTKENIIDKKKAIPLGSS